MTNRAYALSFSLIICAVVGRVLLDPAPASAQDIAPPVLRVAPGADTIAVDGMLSEPAWAGAEAETPSHRRSRVKDGTRSSDNCPCADGQSVLVIGILCDDDPARIVSFSVSRDAPLHAEDHVRIVLGPFLDGRSGYVFAVNPSGARYDGVVTPGGESENAEWDGIWEAATTRVRDGWSAEIRIPIQTLSFKPGLHEWHFNVQRRVQRLLETDRWASPRLASTGSRKRAARAC